MNAETVATALGGRKAGSGWMARETAGWQAVKMAPRQKPFSSCSRHISS